MIPDECDNSGSTCLIKNVATHRSGKWQNYSYFGLTTSFFLRLLMGTSLRNRLKDLLRPEGLIRLIIRGSFFSGSTETATAIRLPWQGTRRDAH